MQKIGDFKLCSAAAHNYTLKKAVYNGLSGRYRPGLVCIEKLGIERGLRPAIPWGEAVK
jgi:hypothetical protein